MPKGAEIKRAADELAGAMAGRVAAGATSVFLPNLPTVVISRPNSRSL